MSVDRGYLNYLHQFDKRVKMNHKNTKNYPSIALLVIRDGFTWTIPLTHKQVALTNPENNFSLFSLVNEKTKKSFGTALICNMIPVVPGTYKRIDKTEHELKYTNLLSDQEIIIKKHLDILIKKVNQAFSYVFFEKNSL